MSRGVHRVLCAQGFAEDTPEYASACHTAFLAADAVTQEAFRADPSGDPALLARLKDMLRAYLDSWRTDERIQS